MIINKRTRFQLQLQKTIFVILLLCLTGMLAWLSQKHSAQFDWTANARNSLSKNSVELLNTLKHPVVINVYAKQDPAVQQAVEEILDRYKRVKNNFEFRIINPDIEIEQARQDEISTYGQVIIKYQNRKENIASLSEQAISSALLRLSRGSTKSVVFLNGHGERDPQQSDNRGYATLRNQLTSKGIEVSQLNLLQNNLTNDISVLVIAAASKTLLPGELKHIDNYIDQGGNLLWLVDPGEMAGLDSLSKKLGIKFQAGVVVDNNVDLRATLQIEHPAIVPVLEYFPHDITRGLDYNTLFPLSRGVEITATDEDDWQHSELFRSFKQSWTETGGLTDAIVFNTADGDIAGPIALGIAIERILASTGNQDNDKASQRITVIGDSDFLANAYVGAGANLSLGMNIFNWLVGDDDLIAVELKAAPDTQLKLDDLHVLLIGTGFFFVLPAALFITGLIIWMKRRKR